MYKNYIFPLQIFLILERLNSNIFFSKKNYYNSYNIFLSNNFFLPFFQILKNEIFLNDSCLIENSALDLKYYNNMDEIFFSFFKKYKNIVFYNFNLFNSKNKLYIYFFFNFKKKLISLDKIFPNSSWIERETSEMYGVYFINKKDHRKLMLDYSSNENPLNKDYPLEGNKQVFFSFFENQVVVQNNKFIEI